MTQTPVRPLDVVTLEEVRGLAAHHGPAVSIFLPTARHGPEVRQGPIRLGNLVREAAHQLEADGVDKPDALLAPVAALVDDVEFWQHQDEALAVFAAADRFHHFRLPSSVPEGVSVNSRFRLRPLLPLVTGHDAFTIVALAQHGVRVFEATHLTVDELPSGSLPASMDDALAHEDHERQLQNRSAGAGQQFHGHGAGGEIEKAALERYFRVVDHALVELLGHTRRPVVLACVDYYLPIYQSVTALPHLLPTVVPGNPEHRSAADLHHDALAVMEPEWRTARAATAERFRTLIGTGKALTDTDAIAAAALEGRVDTLVLGTGATLPDTGEVASDMRLDHAVADVLTTNGSITAADDLLPADTQVAAILRY